MISLSSRQIEIVQFLMQKTDYITIDVLSSMFSVSPRTIRYDLDQIRAFLDESKINFETKPNRGSKINASPEQLSHLKSILFSSKVLSRDDRVLVLSLCLLINQQGTYDSLAELCSVSKQTIITTFAQVEKNFADYNIDLQKIKGQGIVIVADEYTIRNTFIRLVSKLSFEKWLFDSIFSTLYKNPELAEAVEIIKSIESEMKVSYLDHEKIKIILCYCIHRSNTGYSFTQGKTESDFLKIKNQPDFNSMMKALSPFHYSEDEKIYFCWLFMNEKNTQLDNSEYNEDKEANEIAKFLIDKLRQLQPLDEEVRAYFTKGLSMHLKVAIYRIRNNIAIQNELLDQIKISIPLIYEYTKNQLIVLEKTYSLEFDENEIAYIAMYIASAYENSLKVDTQINVLLVCSFGVATSSILRTRIAQIIPECNIIGPLSKTDAEKYVQQNNVDMIISTNEMNFSSVPVITVNPLLYPDDVDYIKTRLFQLSYSQMCNHFLQSYADIDKDNLSKTYIHDLVDADNIQIVDECASWEEAIQLAAKPLLDKHIIEPRYVAKMIDAVNKLGTYMVLVPETAFIHAGTEDGIKHNCTSILILKKPLTFGNKNSKIVRNLVILGIKNKDENSLLDLVYIFEKKTNLEILKTDHITKDIVYDLHD